MHTMTELPEPRDVFRFFHEIAQIPRPSGKEDAIASYLTEWAASRGLEHHRDTANNVIIIKEASAGREQDEPVILQGHMDMVCETAPGCSKDMETEGLDLVLDGDWLYAEGTTLGGDDGIAVAIGLALLDDDTLSHPRLEFVCTTEEETGMGGAHGLDVSPLRGRLLLNIDSEAEGVLTVGCAGGEVLRFRLPLERERIPEDAVPVTLALRGLTGGHSGTAIRHGRANAAVLMGRILRELAGSVPFRLCSVVSGAKNNVIPREAEAVLLTGDTEALAAACAPLESALRAEFAVTDPELSLTWMPAGETPAETCAPVTERSLRNALAVLSVLPNGVQRMDQYLTDLVETSLNLGVLRADSSGLYAECLLRSSLDSCLDDLAGRMVCAAEVLGASVERAERYPAWAYRPDSALREKMVRLFRERYGKDPVVETVHAGLECGLLGEKIPGLDAVSIGPDLLAIHTAEERLSVSSTRRTYAYIRSIIETP